MNRTAAIVLAALALAGCKDVRPVVHGPEPIPSPQAQGPLIAHAECTDSGQGGASMCVVFKPDSLTYKLLASASIVGPTVEGRAIVTNNGTSAHNILVRCTGKTADGLIVWADSDGALDLPPGESEELWLYGHPTRGGRLVYDCHITQG